MNTGLTRRDALVLGCAAGLSGCALLRGGASHPTVEHDGDRAVPAAVRAAGGRDDRADQPQLSVDVASHLEPGVAVEHGDQCRAGDQRDQDVAGRVGAVERQPGDHEGEERVGVGSLTEQQIQSAV